MRHMRWGSLMAILLALFACTGVDCNIEIDDDDDFGDEIEDIWEDIEDWFD